MHASPALGAIAVGTLSLVNLPALAQTPGQFPEPARLATFDTKLGVQGQKVVPRRGSVYTGLFSIGSVVADYDAMACNSGGNTPGIVFTFHDWNGAGIYAPVPVLQTMTDPMENGQVSPLELAEDLARDGAVLAIAWDAIGYLATEPDYWAGDLEPPVRFDDIFAGVYDDYIREVAREIKAFGRPIMLSPAAEFNSIGFVSFGPDGDEYIGTVDDLSAHYGDPSWPDGPERIRDLYRRVVDIFDDEGVTNVTWFMYSHSGYMNPAAADEDEQQLLSSLHPIFYYPGDEYVDWVGTSAYVSNDDPEEDLDYAIGHAVEAFGLFTDKPFMIPEFGVTDAEGDSRASRMRWVFDEELPAMPAVRAWCFADAPLWAEFFGIPRLGNQPDEIPAWIESVWWSGAYTNQIRTR